MNNYRDHRSRARGRDSPIQPSPSRSNSSRRQQADTSQDRDSRRDRDAPRNPSDSPRSWSPTANKLPVPPRPPAAAAPASAPTAPSSPVYHTKVFADLLAERSVCYRDQIDGERRLRKITAAAGGRASNPDFVSEHSLWISRRKEVEAQVSKAAARCEDLDQRIYDALANLQLRLQDRRSPAAAAAAAPDLDARFRDLEASWEKKLDEKVGAHTKEMTEKYEARQSELTRRLDEQAAQTKKMEETIERLYQSVGELTAATETAAAEASKPLSASEGAAALRRMDDMGEKLTSHDRDIADLKARPTAATPSGDSSGRELDMRVTTLREMLKDTMGDVKAVEVRVSRQDAVIEDMVKKTGRAADDTSRLGTPTNLGGPNRTSTSPANDTWVQAYVDARVKEFEDKSRDRWTRIMEGFDKLMQAETTERQRLEKLVKEETTERQRLEQLISTNYAAVTEDTRNGLYEMDKRLAALNPLPGALADLAARSQSKIQEDARIFEDLAYRISHLNEWREHFSTADMVKAMVDHIANTIPKGTYTQIRRLEERVGAVEGQLHDSWSSSIKKRKSEVSPPLNGHA